MSIPSVIAKKAQVKKVIARAEGFIIFNQNKIKRIMQIKKKSGRHLCQVLQEISAKKLSLALL